MESLPGYDAWKTRTPDEHEHVDWCPAHEDNGPFFEECEGLGRCECWPDTIMGLLRAMWYGPCESTDEPPCWCPTEQDLREQAAEERNDRAREDW